MNVYVNKHTKEIQKLHQEIIGKTDSQTTVKEQLEMLAENLVAELQNGNEAVVLEISNCHPELVGKTPEVILNSEFSEEDGRITMAREHGFTDWNEVEKLGETNFDLEFETSIDTMLRGDIDSLREQIESKPRLLKERSKYGHRATLLHYAGSNGVEMRRQVVPLNLPEIVKLLIENGADKTAKANLYGGEFTVLQLAATSAHPKDAGIIKELLRVLETKL